MDKKQRELIKSYFRARMLMANQEQDGYAHTTLEEYEDLVKYTRMGLVDPTPFKRDHILKILKEYPETIKIFKPVLHKIDPDYNEEGWRRMDFADVLKSQPQLLDYFDLNKLKIAQVADILTEQPELIDYMPKEILAKISPESVGHLVFNHPELADFLDMTKIESDGRWIRSILDKDPKLVRHFKNIEDTMQILDAAKLIADHPELINHINFIKYGPDEIKRFLTHEYYNDKEKNLVRKQVKDNG